MMRRSRQTGPGPDTSTLGVATTTRPPGSKNTLPLSQDIVRPLKVLDEMLSDDSMECAIAKRQMGGIGKGKIGSGRQTAGQGCRLSIHVQPDDQGGTLPGASGEKSPTPTTELQNPLSLFTAARLIRCLTSAQNMGLGRV